MPHVESLHVYPVKGCRPIDVQCAWFERTGLAFDRQWMFVKRNKRGRFISQRQHPRIALIETAISTDILARPINEAPADACLTLSAPGMEKLEIPLAASGELIPASLWEFDGTAYDQGDTAAEWITNYLGGESLRLVRYAGVPSTTEVETDTTRRPTDPKWTAKEQEVAFADGYPALIVNQATLSELNRRLKAQSQEPLPMNRFRGNIVATGSHMCEEDEWEELTIGQTVDLCAVKPCDRCRVTCTDQATAEVGKEPLITLKEFRSSKALDWDMGAGVFFGWNLVPLTYGLIRVGDPINCTKRRKMRVGTPGQHLKPVTTKASAVVSEKPDTAGALKAALAGGALAAAIASLLASFFYLLMKAVAAKDGTIVHSPT